MDGTTAREKIAEQARASFAAVLPWIGAIYLMLGALYCIAPPLEPGWLYATTSFAAGTLQILLARWVRVAPRRAIHVIGLTGSLLATAYALSFVYLTRDPAQTVVVVMVLLGAAFMMLTHWTTLTIVAVTTVAWGVIARDFPAHDLVHWGVNLVGTAALAIVISVARIRTMRRQLAVEHELRESEERHRLVLDTALDAVITLDIDNVVRAWNPQAERIFGWRADEIIGRRAPILLTDAHREAYERAVRDFLATGESPILNHLTEVTALARDGRTFPAEMTTIPIQRSDGFVLTAFVRDITGRKRAEDELRRAKDAAEEGARVKADFLATMSHEIRTPLNGIFGMTELALDTEDDDDRREFLERARACADSLMTILNDVLDFSRIDAGRLDLERIAFDPRDVVDGVLDTLAIEAERKGLELIGCVDARVPAQVIGDPGRVRQILINLGGNAIKFTERGEVMIRIELDAADMGDDRGDVVLRGSVRDTGIGIDTGNQRAIFEAFTQADSSMTRRFGGTGLGLAICQRLVALMRGTIGVTSMPGAGSEFWFTTRHERDPVATAVAPPSGALAGRHILVVSDDAAQARHLTHVLRDAGAAVETVPRDGGSGSADPDGVVVDVPVGSAAVPEWTSRASGLVLLASNATRTALQRSGSIRGVVLSKPGKARALVAALAEAVAAGDARAEARRVAGAGATLGGHA